MKKIFFVAFLIIGITFSVFPQYNGSNFYRLRNYSINDDCMQIYHDSINAQDIVKGASSVLADNGEAAMGRVGQYLDIDIKTSKKNTTFTDPGTVIFLQQSSSNTSGTYPTYTCDVIGQGVGLKYISYCAYVGTSAGAQLVTGLPATITCVGEDTDGKKLYTAHVTLNQMGVNQTRFLGDTNGRLTIHSVTNDSATNAPDMCKWYIEPINSTNNYFAAAPVEDLTQNNNYYTSLRAAFSYRIPSNSAVNVYKVTALPSVDGELATLEKINNSSSDIVLAGLPVIIESTSLNSENNIIEPYYHKTNAPVVISTAKANTSGWLITRISSSSITVSGLTDSQVLYNNYGCHGHDVYVDVNHTSGYGSGLKPGWWPKGDNLGFFTSPYYDSQGNKTVHTYYGTQTIYRLGIKDGAVGFWDKVEKTDEVSGNEAYSPKKCQLFPVEKELADIAEDGAVDISYDIVEVDHDHYLYGVKAVDGKLYAKDYRKFRNPNIKSEDAIDGMGKFYDYTKPYDQSNWVALTGLENPAQYEGQNLHVVGKLLNRANPEIKVSNIKAFDTSESYDESEYNHYCPANFMSETQTGTNGKTYFFVQPKPQEVVHIVGAIYGGDNKFYINKPDSYYNTVDLKGGFMIDPSCPYEYTEGTAYEFNAVVKKADPSSTRLNVLPYLDGGVSDEYVVYPFSSPVVTGVQNLDVDAQIVSVKYFNTMGVESTVPFKGVNIVVTTYDNGTRLTSKVIK